MRRMLLPNRQFVTKCRGIYPAEPLHIALPRLDEAGIFGIIATAQLWHQPCSGPVHD